MKQKRFTEGKIISIVKEYEQGKNLAAICRKYGINQFKLFQWQIEHGTNQLGRAKAVEALLMFNKRIPSSEMMDLRAIRHLN